MTKSVIIIGGGLGGLECGYILAKHGYKVTILEKHKRIGGCLQTFHRGGHKDPNGMYHAGEEFDSGFHYVGGLGEGQSLRVLFDYFDLMGLPWKQLDPECFDEVVIGDKSFPFASGHERFVERLSEYFPKEKSNLKKYATFLKGVGDHIYHAFKGSEDSSLMNDLFFRSAYQFLCETISDPLLRKVLSGTSLKMELSAETLPLYVFAQINNSFIQSAWRLEGGGSVLANKLADSIMSMGGELKTGSEVTALREREGVIAEVEVNSSEILSADYVISDIHPAVCLDLIDDTKCIRHIYRSRMANLQNTFGMFTANICLKPETMPYLNKNLYIHSESADLWHPSIYQTESVLVHYYPEIENGYATHLDLMCPMSVEGILKYKDKPVRHRGERYESLKRQKAESCLNLVSGRLPELRDSIDKIFTSTPLTYQSYTSTPNGTAYGLRKDYQNPLTTVLSPRSPVPNLFFTGQNLNLHGILGVSMTSVFTCAEIIGMRTLGEDIFKVK